MFSRNDRSSSGDDRTALRAGRVRWLALGGFFLPLVVFRTLLDPRRILAAGDLAFLHLPLRTLFRRAVLDGFPWWNTAIHGGQPILSNPNYAAFYPPTWLVLPLPPAAAIHLLILAHVGWAYAGAWRLARHLGCRPATALVAAIGFTLGGAFVSSASMLTLFCGLAWTPWILLWANRALEPGSPRWRRDAVLVALGLAAQLLAGDPVNCILSGIALVGLAIDGRLSGNARPLRLAAAIALAIALAGIQLLPTVGRVADSERAGGLEAGVIAHRSMPPVRLLELAVPHPLGDPARIDEELFYGQSVFDEGFPHLVAIYPGLLVFVLAMAGLTLPGVPRRWAWVVMLAAGVLLGLGRHNPLFTAVVPWLPILNRTRYPEEMFLLATTALPFLAALALEVRLSLRSDGETRRWDLATLLCALLAALLAALLGLYLVEPRAVVWLADTLRAVPLPAGYEDRLATWNRRELLSSLLVATAALALVGSGKLLSAKRWQVALLVLLAADLTWSGWRLLPVAPLAAVETEPAVLAGHPPDRGRLFTDFALAAEARVPLRYERPGPDQFWHGVDTLEPYIATLWGYDYAFHHDYDLMLTGAARQALDALEEDWKLPYRAERLLGAWNVGTMALQRPLPEVLRERLGGGAGARLRVVENPHRLAELRWVPRVEFHPDPASALAAARRDEYRFAERAHWVGGHAGEPSPQQDVAGPAPTVEAVRLGWSRLELEPQEAHPPYLQIARTWDAGWRARLDGEPVAVHRTASGQIGLVVPAGARHLELRYFDPTVPAGAALTLIGLCGVVWLWRRERGGGPGAR